VLKYFQAKCPTFSKEEWKNLLKCLCWQLFKFFKRKEEFVEIIVLANFLKFLKEHEHFSEKLFPEFDTLYNCD